MSLGLEATGGFETIGFCEIDAYCRAVLAKHWPGVPCFQDIRALAPIDLSLRGIGPVDVICGGFPCQDLSVAGKGAGLAGARSGLWGEYFRLIRELRPRYVLVENVAALLGRGLGTVVGDLATIGYDAEWHCIPAAYVGAPHRRDRVWIIAYPHSDALRHDEQWIAGGWVPIPHSRHTELADHGGARSMADTNCQGRRSETGEAEAGGSAEELGCGPARADGRGSDVADSDRRRREVERFQERGGQQRARGRELDGRGPRRWRDWSPRADWWQFEPDVGRVANGIPNRTHRLRTLGNAVVPQVVYLIAQAILALEIRKRALAGNQ